MSIEPHPGHPLPATAGVIRWGALASEGTRARWLRFILADRTITFASDLLTRWEHIPGEPETLLLTLGAETARIEGLGLAPIEAALVHGSLCELRASPGRDFATAPGPRIHLITLESSMQHAKAIPTPPPIRFPRGASS